MKQKDKTLKKRRKRIPAWALLLRHGVALGLALVLFALPHHVLLRRQEDVMARSSRNAVTVTAEPTATPQPTAEPAAQPAQPSIESTPEPTPEPTPVPTDAPGSFRIKFADHFTDGEVIRDGASYRSANVDIKVTEHYVEEIPVRYYVADIYIADISCLQAALAVKDGKSSSDWVYEMAEDHGSIIAINGDYAGTRSEGVIIRNGNLYRNKRVSRDVCVLYWDGTMKTFSPREFDTEREMANGAYQAWNFGPILLDKNGNAMDEFNSSVTTKHPRTAIGYYEPGHYCFVVADGRSGSSRGLTMELLSKLMKSLGCAQAYNLDGGKSSMLCIGSEVINHPYEGGRKISDAVMILDRVQGGNE